MNTFPPDEFEVFPWNDNFATQIDVIDEQHQKLVAILNQLAVRITNQASPIDLNTVFNELVEYTDYHFKAEEAIWQQYFIDDVCYKTHQQTHRSFIDKVVALKKEEDYKSLEEIIPDVVRFLTHWLAFHILDTDRRMALVVLGIKSGMTLVEAKAHSDLTMSGSIEVLIDTVLMMYDNLSTRTIELMQEKTARQRAEAELRMNEQRWQFVMERIGDEVWDWDVAENSIYRSDNSLSIVDILSASSDHIENNAHIHPDDWPQM